MSGRVANFRILKRVVRRLAGFTLTELLVVIAVVLIITIAALPAVLGSLNERKFGESARIIQAALAGARDRAIASQQIHGLRFVRDEADPWEVSSLVYVGMPEPYSVGLVTVSGTTVSPYVDPNGIMPTPVFDQVDSGKDQQSGTADDIPRVVPFGSYIRFDSVGQLYLITGVSGSPANLTVTPTPLTLSPSTTHTYQIITPPVPTSQDATIQLPEGIVIDLRTPALPVAPNRPDLELLRLPRSTNLPNQIPPLGQDGDFGTNDQGELPDPATWPKIDILFGPHGSVVGGAATSSLVHLWVGERGDKGGIGVDGLGGTVDDQVPTRAHFLVTLNTRTGAVQVWKDTTPVGTAPNYLEVYDEPGRQLGTSAPLFEEWVR